MFGGETQTAMGQQADSSSNGEPPDPMLVAYQARWNIVTIAFTELRLVELEGQAIWGRGPLTTSVSQLNKCKDELFVKLLSLADHRKAAKLGHGQGDGDAGLSSDCFSVAYAGMSNDRFGASVETAVSAIEGFIRPRMERLKGSGAAH